MVIDRNIEKSGRNMIENDRIIGKLAGILKRLTGLSEKN